MRGTAGGTEEADGVAGGWEGGAAERGLEAGMVAKLS